MYNIEKNKYYSKKFLLILNEHLPLPVSQYPRGPFRLPSIHHSLLIFYNDIKYLVVLYPMHVPSVTFLLRLVEESQYNRGV